MHLTIISYPSTLTPVFEDAARRMDGFTHPRQNSVDRCQRPVQLVQAVANVATLYGKVSLLDLFGHGRPGVLVLGDGGGGEMTVEEVLPLVAGYLQPDAQVRLLGCETGLGEPGHAMLCRISAALGGRTVWGTNSPISGYDFGPDGFLEEVARKVLVSSREPSEQAVASH
jgi:hypothetical protein